MKHLKLFESFSQEKLYHGNRKGDFPPSKTRFGAIFLTPNINFAKNFAGYDERELFPDGAVFEVELKTGLKMMDVTDTKSWDEIGIVNILSRMIEEKYIDPINGTKFFPVNGSGFKGYDYTTDREFSIVDPSQSVYHYLWRIKNGAWRIIECEPISQKIKNLGYDGYYVVEGSNKNVAIFSPNSILDFTRIPL